ncbi:hypothetical protein PDUR_26450 [Paenibacillus durus]|uniref:DNA topology modulation protein FlaR n=1 Tax=Paenibacillus durus TaxID=44251 RepID=A0A089J1F6_PAEDU|nr:hypothetical protein PDUR_26450 [Paenibacillus durus]
MKIRIIGACGSGKTSIAKELSKRYGINYYETDNLVWERNADNRKNSIDVRDSMLNEILEEESWIIEGVHYKWGQDSFKKADLIFLLRPNKYLRDFRVIRRFVRTRLGFEQWNYKQTVKNLYTMIFEWNRSYDKKGIKDILELTDECSKKRVIIRDGKDIFKYIEGHFMGVSGRQ